MFDDNVIDAEPAVEDPEAAKQKVMEFFQALANAKAEAAAAKQPILKQLAELGVPVYTKMVAVDNAQGRQSKCIVIPIDALMLAEYKAATGFDMEGYVRDAEAKRPPTQFNFDEIQNGGA